MAITNMEASVPMTMACSCTIAKFADSTVLDLTARRADQRCILATSVMQVTSVCVALVIRGR